MSTQWADRIRRTNKLVRAVAKHVLENGQATPDQLYGLCKLTWITNSYEDADAAYIRSTKIPALSDALAIDFDGLSLERVAEEVYRTTGSPGIKTLVLAHTGFTNLYKAYRNTARDWIAANASELFPMFRTAYALKDDNEGRNLVAQVHALPGIPLGNGHNREMRPEFLLTPVFASLDKRSRFPLINGNKGVRRVLGALRVGSAPITEQYTRMLQLYGQGGIEDSADLDQVGQSEDLVSFLSINGNLPTRKLLRRKPLTGPKLSLKDESDVVALRRACTIAQKRLHNSMTNKLLDRWAKYGLREGAKGSAMFDVLVTNFDDKGAELLVEVKSAADDPNVRMAIGQLYAYSHALGSHTPRRLAILLPSQPSSPIKSLLLSLGIGLMWLSDDVIKTCTPWLRHLAK
jgi:hypothetical protein